MKQLTVLMVGVAALLVATTSSHAAESPPASTGAQIGTGVGSMVGSALYFPFKASFCILGGVSSGFALLFGGAQAAEKVADTTCRGTWVISPTIVAGKETVHFTGQTPKP